MKYTIEDLRNGKCAVHNNGTIRELEEVLRKAFPKDPLPTTGNNLYYHKSNIFSEMWVASSNTFLPIQSVKDFLEPEFVLPEKWYLKVTGESYKEFKHLRKLHDISGNNIRNGYITSIRYCTRIDWGYWTDIIPYGYNEITLEQFRKYVLKQEEEFMLPKKWCVKVDNDNSKIIYDWLNDNRQNNTFYSNKEEDKNLYVHFPAFNVTSHQSREIQKSYTEITFEEFKKYVINQKEQKMDSRFPFKLTQEQGKRIINCVCNDWRDKLINKWAKDFILLGYVIVDEAFYKEGRQAINDASNRNTLNNILNDIFGKDEPYKIGDYITVVENKHTSTLNGKVGETYRIIKISNESLYFNEDSAIDISRVKVRPASEDEIKEFNRYKYKDGEGVWVKNNFDNPWDFRYTTGKIVDNRIECYHYQKKEGSSRSYWSIYQPAPGVEPPVSVTD